MEAVKNLLKLPKGRRSAAAVTALAAAGLLLIMISSFLPDKKQPVTDEPAPPSASEEYCRTTEKRLRELIRNIDGAGEAEVYLTVGSGERYVYAAEGKKSSSENKTEEEKKYVMTGGSSQRTPLIETVETPEIKGAVIVCTGCGSPAVEERVYKAASAALGIPTSKIYVTKMK